MSSSSPSSQSSSSRQITTFQSDLQSALALLTNQEISSDVRFGILAKVIHAGAQAVQQSQEEIDELQGRMQTVESKNAELELSVERAEKELKRFSELEKQRLQEEVNKALKKLERKKDASGVVSKIAGIGFFVNKFAMLPLAAIPITLAVTVPLDGLFLGFWILSNSMENSAEDKIWILQNYPEALHNEDVRKQAEKELKEIREKEAFEAHMQKAEADFYNPPDTNVSW